MTADEVRPGSKPPLLRTAWEADAQVHSNCGSEEKASGLDAEHVRDTALAPRFGHAVDDPGQCGGVEEHSPYVRVTVLPAEAVEERLTAGGGSGIGRHRLIVRDSPHVQAASWA